MKIPPVAKRADSDFLLFYNGQRGDAGSEVHSPMVFVPHLPVAHAVARPLRICTILRTKNAVCLVNRGFESVTPPSPAAGH